MSGHPEAVGQQPPIDPKRSQTYMATTIKSGMQDTASILSNRLIVDMLEPIQMLDTNLSQFSTILDHPAMRGATLTSYIKEWLEDRLMPRTMALAGGLTA